MTIPTFDAAQIYKSPTIVSQVRAAVGLDYPVFSGHFHDDFNGVGLPDANTWFINHPSWGLLNQAAGALQIGTTAPGIAPSWVQSRHNLAFPLRRDTDWVFETRAAFNPITGWGVFIRICGRSFRDCEAIWAVKANTVDGLEVHCPDGFFSDTVLWANGADNSTNRYRVRYDHAAQNYICDIDADDDGTFEIGPFVVPVNGRYADAIVLGNSTAIQGGLGAWTQINADYVDVLGTVEAVEDAEWAAPFTYEGTRFAYLPQLLSGRVSIDKDNLVDATELTLDNYGITEELGEARQLYTWCRFLNRRAIVEARAGDGDGRWTNWQILFNGLCAEKQIELQAGGRVRLTLPMRDRYRAVADDLLMLGAYSDAAAPIPGVGMNMTVAQIMADIYTAKCGLPGAAYNIIATPNNVPRNYNIFRKTAQQAIRDLADMTALALYQNPATGQIQVAEWYWGTDDPGYTMNTKQEIQNIEWTESAFDVTSAEQLAFENTNLGGGGFQCMWPPHREPFYGRMTQGDAVTCQTGVAHDARPVNALAWWARNRKLGSVTLTALAQLWFGHNDEVRIADDRFLGVNDTFLLDGWEHSWEGAGPIVSKGRFIYPHPDRFLRKNLMP